MLFKILGCGTSTGVPIPGCRCGVCTSKNPKNVRNRTSGLISLKDGQNILIDATTDLRHQALLWGVNNVNSVLFTHAHADHILGIDDLRCFNFVQGTSIPCFGTANTLEQIRDIFSYVFNPDPTYEGGAVPRLTLQEIDDSVPFETFGIKIQPFPLLHGKASVTGFRFGELAYATDCNAIPKKAKEILKGVRFLILDALRYEPHKTHFTIPEAIEAAKEIGAEKTYLTHMTHSIDYEETSSKLPKGVELAWDGLEIEFNN